MTAPPPARVGSPTPLLPAAVAGLSWASVFEVGPLAAPVLAAVLPVWIVDRVAPGRLRAPLGLLLGAAAFIGLLSGLGGGDLAGVLDGVLAGWRRTLESTLPARAAPAVVGFVPALALLAGVLGVEWSRRGAAAPLTLVPSLVVLATGQLFHAATGPAAILTAAGYGVAAAVVLAAGRRRPGARVPAAWPRRLLTAAAATVPLLVVAGGAAVGLGALGPWDRAALSLQDAHDAATRPASAPDPLAEVGGRLAAGDAAVFTVTSDRPTDRWTLAVLGDYDDANFAPPTTFRVLGASLAAPPTAAAVTGRDALVRDVELEGPWLPSQPRLRTVDGAAPLVDPATGVLVATEPVRGYRIAWDAVEITRESLVAAELETDPTGAVRLGEVPRAVADLAREAVGPDVAPSVQVALLLEKWLTDNYRNVEEGDIPTGHSTAQILHFLTTGRQGTSEQFATAYVLLATSLGIPTRLAVGFRDVPADAGGTRTIRNSDALAWPEIAVRGVGWVPLDPTGGAREGGSAGDSLAQATQAARDQLPDPAQVAAQQASWVPAAQAPPAPSDGSAWWWAAAGTAAAVLACAVPLAKVVRRAGRRRGSAAEAVVGATREVRGLLADHGVAVRPGATVRDLAAAAAPLLDRRPLDRFAQVQDDALWSGRGVHRDLATAAWSAHADVRRALRRRSPGARLRAAYSLRSLRGQEPQAAPRMPVGALS